MDSNLTPIQQLEGPAYTCLFCEREFQSHWNGFMHLRIHIKEKPIFCKVCASEFVRPGELLTHERSHLSKDMRHSKKCRVCAKHFKTKELLNQHMVSHNTNIRCKLCNKFFNSRSSLTTHMWRHSNVKDFNCSFCPWVSSSSNRRDLTSHIKQCLVNSQGYKCDLCQAEFQRKDRYIGHLRTHTGEKPYKCAICDKTFTLKTQLKTHERLQHLEPPAECNICGKVFKNRQYVSSHVKTFHNKTLKECHLCDKKLSGSHHLRRHLLTHTGERPHHCEICDKSFPFKCNLSDHIKYHHASKRFSCQLCSKKFKTRSSLRSHIRVHKHCIICGKTVRPFKNLEGHVLAHTREKPWFCDKCGQEFTWRRSLKNHLKRLCQATN